MGVLKFADVGGCKHYPRGCWIVVGEILEEVDVLVDVQVLVEMAEMGAMLANGEGRAADAGVDIGGGGGGWSDLDGDSAGLQTLV